MWGYGFWLAAISIGFVLLGAFTTFWPPARKRAKVVCMIGFAALAVAHVWLTGAQENAADKEQEDQKGRLAELRQELKDARSETSKSDDRLANLQRFSIQRIADLQAEVRSEQLRRELESVKRELVAVRTAPRAKLEFGFEREGDVDRLLHEITVPVVDKTARVRLAMRNPTEVIAEQANVWIRLPKGREITKEESPVRLRRPRDSEPSVRHFPAGDIPARATITAFLVEVSVSPEYDFFDVTFTYSCRTCVSKDMQVRRVKLIWPSGLSGTPSVPPTATD